jgi:thiol:disulfide interchange protein DsbD
MTLLGLLCLTAQSPAQEIEPQAQPIPVRVKMTSPTTSVVPGQKVVVNIELEIDDGWHVYSQNPGDIGKPTEIELVLPPGVNAGTLTWPTPETYEDFGFKATGYSKRLVVTATIAVPANAAPGESLNLAAKVSWLACKDSCIPDSTEVSLTLPVVAGTVPVPTGTNAATSGWANTLYFMAMAALGGMLLNLMPCVLPVVSLKILSFARQAGDDRKRIFRLGLAYAAGTLVTFSLLACVVIALQQFGVAVGWGFHFQHPAFVIGMASVVAVMSISMFGVFDISINAGNQQLGSLSMQEGWKGAFFTGVLATLLSTPCTAPFLGTALGFAFTQHWLVILLVFLSIGAGLSAPYVLLSWQPAWLKLVPKPGDWMVRFKEAMGFAMLLTVVWLLSVLVAQCGTAALLPAMLWLMTLAFCSWLVGSFAPPYAEAPRRRKVWALALIIAGISGWFFLPGLLTNRPEASAHATASGITSEPFSEAALQKHLAAGRVVLLDFTAQWCLTCQVYEQTVLASADVQQALQATDTVVLRCDWTNGEPLITAKLREFGRSGVPLYVVYSPHRPASPQVLPDVLTRALVLEALENARKP